MARIYPLILCGLALALSGRVGAESDHETGAFLNESFQNLEEWEPLTFDSIPRRSTYTIEAHDDGDGAFLRMRSEDAGSGLLLSEPFDPRRYPVIEWRWRVDDGIDGADHSRKSGDDYPVRVYLFFEYDGTGLSFRDRMRYAVYRRLRGTYPPHSAITYVWATSPVSKNSYTSPHADRVWMRVLRDADAPTGTWKTERVDVLEDYRRLFGEAPPETPMRIAVMTDSDDTGQSTDAALDWIIVRARNSAQEDAGN